MKKLLCWVGVLVLMCGLFCGNMAEEAPAAVEEAVETLTCGDYRYVLQDDGTAKIVSYVGQDNIVEIPAEVDGHAVAVIGEAIFGDWTCWPRSITIPEGVTTIEDYAFYGCSDMGSVYIPDSVMTIGNNPFAYCTDVSITVSPYHPVFVTSDGTLINKLEKKLITYPNTEGWWSGDIYDIPEGTLEIGDSAFAGCSDLSGVIIPDSVTTIGDFAFSGCDELKSITIPDSVTTIGANPFFDCDKLESITVSENHPVFAVMDGALFNKQEKKLISYCDALGWNRYDIPQGIVEIGDGAFADAEDLVVSIPDSVTRIGEDVFSDFHLSLQVKADSFAEQYAKDNDIAYSYAADTSWLAK